MIVIVVAIPDIPEHLKGDKATMVAVYEDGKEQSSRTFSCFEVAENWVKARWPSAMEHPRTNPPTPIDGRYHDDPEVRWVGVVA